MKNMRPSLRSFVSPRIVLSLALCLAGGMLAVFSFAGIPAALVRTPAALVRTAEERPRLMPVPDGEGNESEDLNRMEEQWHDRLTYPTGKFDPAWVRRAAEDDA